MWDFSDESWLWCTGLPGPLTGLLSLLLPQAVCPVLNSPCLPFAFLLSLLLSFFLSLLSLSVCFSPTPPPPLCVSLSLYCFSPHFSLPFCLSPLPLSAPLSLPTTSLPTSLPFCLSPLPLSAPLSPPPPLSPPFLSRPHHLSFLHHSLSLSFSLSIYLSLSISLSPRQRELFLLQQQAAVGSDAVLTQAAAGEDGRGMELPRISTQCECSGPAHGFSSSAARPNPAPGSRPAPQTHPRKDKGSPKTDALPQVRPGDKTLQEARAELTEVRKRWHSLQVEIESLHALERGLQSSLHHTQHHYSLQLRDLSTSVRNLEAELEGVRDGLATQRQQHSQLLNTKMKLEREIATYRRLLEHEEGRFLGVDGQTSKLKPWRCSTPLVLQNGVCDGSEDCVSQTFFTETPASPGQTLTQEGGLIILTEPIESRGGKLCTVKTQEILEGNVVRESAEGHGRVETEKIDKVIKQWEGSFFKGNPKLRKKSVSLRFDLHMAVADDGCTQTKQDSVPDVEVRLVMKRSRSIPYITP